MRYEVEQKFPVADLKDVARRLASLGAEAGPPREEIDLYFAHPLRDFAATDEALRIRCKDKTALITYKGPKIDRTTKTRREIELPLAGDEQMVSQWRELLEVLGFRPVAEVRKLRGKAVLAWHGRTFVAALDDVDRLGTFVELETLTGPDDLEAAKADLASLAEQLDLKHSQRRSYLELLLDSPTTSGPPGNG